MKCFTIIAGTIQKGIVVQDDKIVLGEIGRGRKRLEIPLPPRGSVVEEDRLLEVRGFGPEKAALVCIRDHSGFRGGWHLREARTEDEWDLVISRRRAHRPPDGHGPINEKEGHIDTWGLGYTKVCPACEAIGPLPQDREFKGLILGQGCCAQGDAGRMGGGPEYLLVLRDGEAIEIVRSGRLYGEPAVVGVRNVNGIVEAYDPKAEAETRAAGEMWSKLTQFES